MPQGFSFLQIVSWNVHCKPKLTTLSLSISGHLDLVNHLQELQDLQGLQGLQGQSQNQIKVLHIHDYDPRPSLRHRDTFAPDN